MDRMDAVSVSLPPAQLAIQCVPWFAPVRWELTRTEGEREGNLPARPAIYSPAAPIANPSQPLPNACSNGLVMSRLQFWVVLPDRQPSQAGQTNTLA